jgi:hypothetical protein
MPELHKEKNNLLQDPDAKNNTPPKDLHRRNERAVHHATCIPAERKKHKRNKKMKVNPEPWYGQPVMVSVERLGS